MLIVVGMRCHIKARNCRSRGVALDLGTVPPPKCARGRRLARDLSNPRHHRVTATLGVNSSPLQTGRVICRLGSSHSRPGTQFHATI